jgi:glycerate 2-kinase
MRIVVAPQEFKGTLTAAEAAQAMVAGAVRALPDGTLDAVPLSDGGPGLIDAIEASRGGSVVMTTVQDPLGRLTEARWLQLEDGTAVIESAEAAGLTLLNEDERDPRVTTSYGVGQLVAAALDRRSGRIIVGLGGSATNDGGAGMAAALGVRFLDSDGSDLPRGGSALAALDKINISTLDPRLSETSVLAAADVTNPLCGPEGASLVYGPQKGASGQVAMELDAALFRYGDIVERDVGVPVLTAAGAGAAGGLAAGLIAFAGAEVRPGFEVVAEAVGLRERLAGADLLLTGEGRLDRQTVYGKTVASAGRLAAEYGVGTLVVPGSLAAGWEAVLEYADAVEPVAGTVLTVEEAMARPAEALALTVERALAGWRRVQEIEGGTAARDRSKSS